MQAETLVTCELVDGIAQVRFANPPVNALGVAVRKALADTLARIADDDDAKAVLISTAGRVFSAGADIGEFEGAMAEPILQEVQATIEHFAKPIVFAIQGLAFGAGLELAIAGHYRVASSAATFGFPEITLGIIPGAGGTQRASRLAGLRKTLEMMLTGKPIGAAEALSAGLIDEVAPGDVHEAALAFTRRLVQAGAPVRRTRDRPVEGGETFAADAAELLKANARALKGRGTQAFLLEALQAAAEKPFAEGLATEMRLGEQAIASRESQALRHMFFAERKAAKVPQLAGVKAAPLASVAVVGAGTMGSGIAAACADGGLQVTLIDSSSEGLARGEALIADTYRGSVKRGRLTEAAAAERRARIRSALDLEAAAGADLVIEAVFEDLELKRQVIQRLDEITRSTATLATNTSSLSVADIARDARHPDRVIGLHFFSPANVMKLVEVVHTRQTSAAAQAQGMNVARALGKIGVASDDTPGFIGNRMMQDGYWREAELLLLEGASPTQVDRAIEQFGLAMGPFRVSDLGGTDIGTKSRVELYKRETRADPYFAIADALTAMGRLGQKTHAGFYRYAPEDSRTAIPDPEVDVLIERLASERNIARRAIDDAEIVERCLLALINVGAQVLEEGIALRASDVDVVWVNGYGFPRYLGGPLFYADTLGIAHVVERVEFYRKGLGDAYWTPSPLLLRLAEARLSFKEWDETR